MNFGGADLILEARTNNTLQRFTMKKPRFNGTLPVLPAFLENVTMNTVYKIVIRHRDDPRVDKAQPVMTFYVKYVLFILFPFLNGLLFFLVTQAPYSSFTLYR